MAIRTVSLLFLGVALMAGSFGCVKVSTDLTTDEATEIAQQTASRIRAEWAKEIEHASPSQRVRLLHSLWSKVTSSYINVGYEAVEKWRNLESVHDDPVCASDVKKMVDKWRVTEEPVFAAYEDNIKFTLQEVERAHYFEPDFIETVKLLDKQYERVCAVAFNPVSTPDDYEYVLDQLEIETLRIGDRVKKAMTVY